MSAAEIVEHEGLFLRVSAEGPSWICSVVDPDYEGGVAQELIKFSGASRSLVVQDGRWFIENYNQGFNDGQHALLSGLENALRGQINAEPLLKLFANWKADLDHKPRPHPELPRYTGRGNDNNGTVRT